MEEMEIEEGEAVEYMENEDGTTIDPDHDFSYLDVKIENVLGHFQKYFEGGVSVENLGTKFGGYGSFLPTYQRSPSIYSKPKSPQKFQNHSETKSLNNQPMKGAGPLSALPPLGFEAASFNSNLLDSSKGDKVAKPDSCSPSKHVSKQSPVKAETSTRQLNPTEQRILKLRIKVGSDKLQHKNAAIYSDFGLNVSPSSSLEKSPEEIGDRLAKHYETMNESPTSILQIMTSCPVPGGIILSPLNDVLLSLTRKDLPLVASKSAVDHMDSQRQITVLMDESVCELGNEEVQKENEMKLELKHGSCKEVENDIHSAFVKFGNNKTLEGKECLSNDLKLNTLSKPECDGGELIDGTSSNAEVSKQISNSTSYDSEKEDFFELAPSKYGDDRREQETRSSLSEDILRNSVSKSHKDDSVDIGEDGRAKNDLNFLIPPKADADVAHSKEDPNLRVTHPLKRKTIEDNTSSKREETKIPDKRRKTSSESSRKSIKSLNNIRPATNLVEGRLKAGHAAVLLDEKHGSSEHDYRSKVCNRKPQKDICIVKGGERNPLGDGIRKGKDKQIALQQRSSANMFKESDHRAYGEVWKDYKHKAVEEEQRVVNDKPKERSSVKKGDTKSRVDHTVKETPLAGTQFMDEGLLSEAVPATAPAVVIEDNWVCCDSCEQWRLLPFGTKPEQLPEKWICTMLDWLPGMNRCDISEEETTKALNALYRFAVPEAQNDKQDNANGTALGVNPVDIWKQEEKNHNLGSNAMHIGQKNKIELKEAPLCHPQESVKCRSLYDMNQSHSESNMIKPKSGLKGTAPNSVNERYLHKPKGKQINGGVGKKAEVKNKCQADQSVYQASKKIKVDVNHSDIVYKSEHDKELVRAGTFSDSGFSPNAARKMVCAKAAKGGLVKKAQRYHDGISLQGSAGNCKKDAITKKKKFKDPLDEQARRATVQCSGRRILHPKVAIMEESSENEFNKKEKFRGAKMRNMEHSRSKGGEESNKIGRVSRLRSSGSADHQYTDMEQVSSLIGKDKLLEKQVKIRSQRTSNDVHKSKREPENRETSVIVTSSSSMVSGSWKSKMKKRDGKGSPDESVSSSPCRNATLDRPARRITLGKVGANDTGPSPTRSPKTFSVAEQKGDKSVVGEALISESQCRDSNSMRPLGLCLNEGRFSGQFRKDEQNLASPKDCLGRCSNDNTRDNQPKFEENDCLDINQGGLHTIQSANLTVGVEVDVLSNSEDKQETLALGQHAPNHDDTRVQNSPSLLKKESSTMAVDDALREAKSLQDYADRLKNSGFAFESNEVYFQCGLQYLHGASLLEACNSNNLKYEELTQMQLYKLTAEICKSCAQEFERRKEMAAAALAYKCVEVACMRVVYCRQSSISRDRHELQATLQMVPYGESPSSSASDLDNLNNQGSLEKPAVYKGTGSYVAGNHFIVARNRPNFIRLLDFTQQVNYAMEASRKSQNAFAAANEILEESLNREHIASVKRVTDFSFQDVEGLVDLVRLAMGALGHSSFGGSRD